MGKTPTCWCKQSSSSSKKWDKNLRRCKQCSILSVWPSRIKTTTIWTFSCVTRWSRIWSKGRSIVKWLRSLRECWLLGRRCAWRFTNSREDSETWCLNYASTILKGALAIRNIMNSKSQGLFLFEINALRLDFAMK